MHDCEFAKSNNFKLPAIQSNGSELERILGGKLCFHRVYLGVWRDIEGDKKKNAAVFSYLPELWPKYTTVECRDKSIKKRQ